MPNATCLHNWCDGCSTGSTENDTHESRAVTVLGVDQPRLGVRTQVSYVDGDREPLLYITSGDVELTPEGLDELISVLQEQRQIMRATRPVALRVVA